MAHHFVTILQNGTALCHHSMEWHITLSPSYRMTQLCVTIL